MESILCPFWCVLPTPSFIHESTFFIENLHLSFIHSFCSFILYMITHISYDCGWLAPDSGDKTLELMMLLLWDVSWGSISPCFAGSYVGLCSERTGLILVPLTHSLKTALSLFFWIELSEPGKWTESLWPSTGAVWSFSFNFFVFPKTFLRRGAHTYVFTQTDFHVRLLEEMAHECLQWKGESQSDWGNALEYCCV